MTETSTDRIIIDYFLPENFELLVRHFETGELPLKIWRQLRSHLIAATWYCYCFDFETAVSKLRQLIPIYNEKHGIVNSDSSGYHETLTVFWTTMIYEVANGDKTFASFVQAVEAILLKYGNKRRPFDEFYSFDIMSSKEARLKWIPPDLQALN